MATEERERLIQEMAAEKDYKRKAASNQLLAMCEQMDQDGNDELTIQDMRQRAYSNLYQLIAILRNFI